MACIRQRRGRWVFDYRDATGRRRWEAFATKHEAEDALAAALPASRQHLSPTVDPNATVKDYSERWLVLCAGLKPKTLESYRGKLDNHILPTFGTLPIRRLHRSAIKTLLAEKRAAGLSVDSVRLIHCALRGMLNAAVDEGIIASNPAAGLGRSMTLSPATTERPARSPALEPEPRGRFLAPPEKKVPR